MKKLLCRATEILLLDESIAGLDEPTRERIMELLKNSGLSYIIVSHDHDFIKETTQVLYQIKDGIINKLESLIDTLQLAAGVNLIFNKFFNWYLNL